MTQAELERELSDLTGESLGEIRRRGFSLVEVAPEPLSIDWDELQQVERFAIRRVVGRYAVGRQPNQPARSIDFTSRTRVARSGVGASGTV